MNKTPRSVLLLVSCGEVDPAALRELRRAVSDGYGARLCVRPHRMLTSGFRLHLIGAWTGHTQREVLDELSPLIEASFYTLDWLEDAG